MKNFNLEAAIKAWVESLNTSVLEDGTRQELENHLRDSIEDYMSEGMTDMEAFELAVGRTGKPKALAHEEVKARSRVSSNFGLMILQTFLIQWRLVKRRSIYSLINVFGLSLGFACCLLIVHFIRYELSYDNFHTKAERIFRIGADATVGGADRSWALIPSSLAPALYNELPEVIDYAQVMPVNKSQHTVKFNNELFDESSGVSGQVYKVDTSFFKVFDFEFITGDRKNALIPNSVVITESKAQKIFNRTDVLGEVIEIVNIGKLAITGVLKEPPSNAHFEFGYLVYSDFKNNPSIPFFWVRTYLLTNSPNDQLAIESKIQPIVERVTAETLLNNNIRLYPFLQNLRDIHLTSNLEYEIGANGDRQNILSFGLIALVILLIAGINFTNLATAKSTLRAKEVGVRKVLGARKGQLISQFLTESMAMSLMALALSIGLIALALPLFNSLTDKNFLLVELLDPFVIVIAVLVSLGVGVAAGIYPAFLMSTFKPLIVLKGVLGIGPGKGALRKSLVVLQFAISIVLIFSTIVVLWQTQFMKNQRLGFTTDQILVVPVDRAWTTTQLTLVKSQMLDNPGVISASLSSHIPGMRGGVMVMLPEGFASTDTQMMDGIYGDFDFLKTYDLEVLFGRDFNVSLTSDSLNFVLNEAAIKKFGWPLERESIGRKLGSQNNGSRNLQGNVIGVVKDAHFRSLHHAISPMLFGVTHSRFPFMGVNYLSLRLQGENISGTVKSLEERWNSLSLDITFNSFFLDQQFDAQYGSEEKLSKLFIYFSFLAIFIACLGLFALAAFTTERKRKEIGIRKTLGASVLQLSGKIAWAFTKWVLIANIIAWPFAGFLMDGWLAGFAYRMVLSPWLFLVAMITSLLIAWLTVSYLSLKAARANPVKALRYE